MIKTYTCKGVRAGSHCRHNRLHVMPTQAGTNGYVNHFTKTEVVSSYITLITTTEVVSSSITLITKTEVVGGYLTLITKSEAVSSCITLITKTCVTMATAATFVGSIVCMHVFLTQTGTSTYASLVTKTGRNDCVMKIIETGIATATTFFCSFVCRSCPHRQGPIVTLSCSYLQTTVIE